MHIRAVFFFPPPPKIRRNSPRKIYIRVDILLRRLDTILAGIEESITY